jgi:hypothetical protein
MSEAREIHPFRMDQQKDTADFAPKIERVVVPKGYAPVPADTSDWRKLSPENLAPVDSETNPNQQALFPHPSQFPAPPLPPIPPTPAGNSEPVVDPAKE